MPNYAGFKASGMIRGFAGASGEAHIEAQKAVLRDRIVKAWTEERKATIRKYQRQVATMRRVSDGINDFVEHKAPLSLEEMRKVETESRRARRRSQRADARSRQGLLPSR